MTIKIDICAYDAPDNVGGPYIWIQRMPAKLQELGFNVRVRLFSWQTPELGYAYRALQEQGIPVQSTIFSDTETNVRWLLKMAEADRPDVFVINHVIPAFYAGKYLKKAGIASIGVLRSDDPFYHAIAERFIYPTGPSQVSAVVCVSEYLRRQVLKNSVASLPVRRISSGSPIPLQPATPPNDTLRIAYVGRIVEEQKQASLLTRALIRAAAEVQGVEATLYGDGSARETVERIIADSGVANVRYGGNLTSAEIEPVLLKTHVIVMLSDYEGAPMAIIEGMACGCVPVCLNIRSGIPELVENNVTGLLVENRGESFVAAIKRLREDLGLWKRLSENARSRIEGQHSIGKCASDWAELVNSAYQSRSRDKTFRCPVRLRLPATHVDFAHQDWRKPSVLKQLRSDIAHRFRRTRFLAGRFRRILLGKPIP